MLPKIDARVVSNSRFSLVFPVDHDKERLSSFHMDGGFSEWVEILFDVCEVTVSRGNDGLSKGRIQARI